MTNYRRTNNVDPLFGTTPKRNFFANKQLIESFSLLQYSILQTQLIDHHKDQPAPNIISLTITTVLNSRSP